MERTAPSTQRPEILDLDAYRELIDRAVGGVLFNVSNYPEKAQVRLLGQDTSPLRTKVTGAVMEAYEIFALVAEVRRLQGVEAELTRVLASDRRAR